MNTRSPTECPSWAKLAQHAESWRGVHLRELFAADAARGQLERAALPSRFLGDELQSATEEFRFCPPRGLLQLFEDLPIALAEPCVDITFHSVGV